MKYFTRPKVRRVYEWCGEPLSFNRRLKTYEYGSIAISGEGLLRTTVISTGQHILIEGYDEDNPYVAKVIRLFGDENGEQMKAIVQWFMQVSEVPVSKLKLLGREPHPQEIFYYDCHSCDNEVNVESILRPVKVKHLDSDAPFPDSTEKDVLYVKLSWDSKIFRVVNSTLVESLADPAPASSPPLHLKPSPTTSPSRSQSAVTPTGPSRHALPTPEPTVMQSASLGDVRCRRATMSAGKAANAEAESLHSATKLSASKCLSAKRRNVVARTPGVCKRLELSSPEKLRTSEKVLSQLLDGELKSKVTLAHRPTPSHPHPHPLPLTHSLTPLRKDHRLTSAQGGVPLKNSSVFLNMLSLSELDSRLLPTKGDSTRASTVSQKKEPTATKESARGVLQNQKLQVAPLTPSGCCVERVEMENENSPVPLVTETPRSSKRKSAMLVSLRIRKQLNLLDNQQDLNSSGEDEDEFVPSKSELQSSSDEENEDEGELDNEVTAKKCRFAATGSRTPRSRQKPHSSTRTPLKTPAKKIIQGTPRTTRHATPSIPSRSLQTQQPANILEEARAKLHVSSVPESLPCREQEFQDIYSFVESKIIDSTGGCMYISGVPGTGKTATVHEVIRCLQHAASMDEIPSFHFIEINGMKMTDPHQAYVQILQKLTGQKATADHAAALLEKRFSNLAHRKETTVLLVDELDLLWTRKQNVLYNLFEWPTRRHTRLVVLTIANTMDLPERIMINRVASRLGLTRMSFQPYSFRQLLQIIMSRLNKMKAFEEDALQLVSRKVAALSGDARRCLDICRRATEICEQSASDPNSTGLVGMSHMMEALNEMFSSPYVTAIKYASTQEQLFLRAVIAEFRRLGVEEATFQQVFVQHQALCRVEGLQSISVSEGLAVCQRLGACRLLLLETSCLGVLQRVRLNVSQDDILYALKAN